MSYNPRRIPGRSAVDEKTSALEKIPKYRSVRALECAKDGFYRFHTGSQFLIKEYRKKTAPSILQLFAFNELVSNGSIQTTMLA